MRIRNLVARGNRTALLSVAVVVLLAGVGVTLRSCSRPAGVEAAAVAKYQCPMHPQIVQDHPGDCPICHMHLVRVTAAGAAPAAPPARPVGSVPGKAVFTLSEERRQLIGVKTGTVERRRLSRRLRLPGRSTGGRIVIAELLEMDAGTVRAGMKAELSGPQDQRIDAAVTGVDTRFDALTRSFAVTLEAAGDAGWLKPGVYCEADVILDFGPRLAVPADAVLYSGERLVVFLTDGKGRFEPREIRTGKAGEDWVEVLSGLKEGDRVVTSANFLIDSESRFRAALEQF